MYVCMSVSLYGYCGSVLNICEIDWVLVLCLYKNKCSIVLYWKWRSLFFPLPIYGALDVDGNEGADISVVVEPLVSVA